MRALALIGVPASLLCVCLRLVREANVVTCSLSGLLQAMSCGPVVLVTDHEPVILACTYLFPGSRHIPLFVSAPDCSSAEGLCQCSGGGSFVPGSLKALLLWWGPSTTSACVASAWWPRGQGALCAVHAEWAVCTADEGIGACSLEWGRPRCCSQSRERPVTDTQLPHATFLFLRVKSIG